MRSSYVSSGQSKNDSSRKLTKVGAAYSVEVEVEVEQIPLVSAIPSPSNTSNTDGLLKTGFSSKALLNQGSISEIPVSTTNETAGSTQRTPTVLKGASKNMLRKKKCLDAIGQEFKLFFKFLNKRTDLETLNEVFSSYGEVVHLRIPFSQKKKKNLGYGYVIFSQASSIDQIMNLATPVIVDGKPLVFYTFDQSRYRNEEESTSILTTTGVGKGARRQEMRSLSLAASSADSIDNGQLNLSKKSGRQFDSTVQNINSKVNQDYYVKVYGQAGDPSILPTKSAYHTSRSRLLTRQSDNNGMWLDPNLRWNITNPRAIGLANYNTKNLGLRTNL